MQKHTASELARWLRVRQGCLASALGAKRPSSASGAALLSYGNVAIFTAVLLERPRRAALCFARFLMVKPIRIASHARQITSKGRTAKQETARSLLPPLLLRRLLRTGLSAFGRRAAEQQPRRVLVEIAERHADVAERLAGVGHQ